MGRCHSPGHGLRSRAADDRRQDGRLLLLRTVALWCADGRRGGEEDRDLAGIGIHLGIAFQLVDDLIGAFGTPAQAGREAGSDLREGKRTPLVALARGAATWPEVEGALALAHTGPFAVRRARLELERSGARDGVAELVEQHLESARSLARSFSNGVAALVEDVATEIEGRMP